MDTKEIKVGSVYSAYNSRDVRRVVAMGDPAIVGDRAFVEFAVMFENTMKTPSSYSFGQCSLAEFAAWVEHEVINEAGERME